MHSISLIFKNAFEMWRQSTFTFWGEKYYICIFVLALISALFFDKNKSRKLTFVGYTLLVLVGIYNPVTYYLCNIVFNGSVAYFCRVYQLLLVPLIISYAFVVVLEKNKGIIKIALICFFGGVAILCGDCVYNEEWMQKADNFTKLPNDVVEICDAVHGYKDDVCIAVPTDLSKY